ncbi:protein of unknown function [Magnetospirillum sp. XM-1]|nr:protein of unknown function [Magnetospirillum sp. XM-1]
MPSEYVVQMACERCELTFLEMKVFLS